MNDLKAYVVHYLGKLSAPGREDAYHCLIEADKAVIPLLVDAYRAEKDHAVRANLVEVIWQHRVPDTVEFLAEALNDPAPDVWKSALDGLVAMGGASAKRVLEIVRSNVVSDRASDKIAWLDEALHQIGEPTSADFRAWRGYAKRIHERRNPRFQDDADLWDNK